MFVGHADAAMHLDPLLHRQLCGIARLGLGGMDEEVSLLVASVG